MIDDPASEAPTAASTISLGVIGRYGLMVGVWIEPVTAQVMMTFLSPDIASLLREEFRCAPQGASARQSSVRQPSLTGAPGSRLGTPDRLGILTTSWPAGPPTPSAVQTRRMWSPP